MAKRNRQFTDEKYEKWLKEKRGQGRGKEYKPWLTIQDVPSSGMEIRLKGTKIERQYDFFSNHEKNYYFILEFADHVEDIQEQYPLLFREETIAIAEELGISHPKDPISKDNIVITTDFLITIKENNQLKQLARTVKPSDKLDDKRVIEKFEIERVYWERKGIDWKIITEKEINQPLALNLEHLRVFKEINNSIGLEQINSYQLDVLLIELQSRLINNKNKTIRTALHEFDEQFSLNIGTSITMFKHLVYTKKISMDLRYKLDLDQYQKLEQLDLIRTEVI